MGRAEQFWDLLSEGADLEEEMLPGLPIVEIADNSRVVLENHLGIIGYGQSRIVIKVKKGCVHICGDNLSLRCMTKERITIIGRIDSVILQRRD